MALPRFNFTRLLIDLATAHNMPPPIFVPAVHPLPGHHAFVCQYSGVDAIGGGATEVAARNSAARQVWIEMGHLITVDPRYVFYCILLVVFGACCNLQSQNIHGVCYRRKRWHLISLALFFKM